MQRPYYAGETIDESAVEVAKSKENLYIAVGFRGVVALFGNSLNSGRIYSNPLRIDNKSKVIHFRFEEVALLRINI